MDQIKLKRVNELAEHIRGIKAALRDLAKVGRSWDKYNFLLKHVHLLTVNTCIKRVLENLLEEAASEIKTVLENLLEEAVSELDKLLYLELLKSIAACFGDEDMKGNM